MYLTIKDLQVYLGGVSPSTAERFKNEVLTSLGLKRNADVKCRKKNKITAHDVAKYHGVPVSDVLTILKEAI